MGAAENRAKNQAMAAHLLRMGYWHGRRATVGLSGYPVSEPGSAAYRRLQRANRGRTNGVGTVPTEHVRTELPKPGSLAGTRAGICLSCGSDNTRKTGRLLACRRCEVTYYIPAVQLTARPESPASATNAGSASPERAPHPKGQR